MDQPDAAAGAPPDGADAAAAELPAACLDSGRVSWALRQWQLVALLRARGACGGACAARINEAAAAARRAAPVCSETHFPTMCDYIKLNNGAPEDITHLSHRRWLDCVRPALSPIAGTPHRRASGHAGVHAHSHSHAALLQGGSRTAMLCRSKSRDILRLRLASALRECVWRCAPICCSAVRCLGMKPQAACDRRGGHVRSCARCAPPPGRPPRPWRLRWRTRPRQYMQAAARCCSRISARRSCAWRRCMVRATARLGSPPRCTLGRRRIECGLPDEGENAAQILAI